MNKFVLVSFSFMLLAHHSFCQTIMVSGIIEDKSTGERIIGAMVKNMSQNNGSISNAYGHYAIQTNSSPTVLRVSMLGFETVEYQIVAQKDTTLHVALNPIELDEVVVRGDKQVKKNSISAIHFESPDLLDHPSIKPEVDILNVIQIQSGVQSGLEGSVGFSVRGGNNDQNLILMDNIPLYNTGHLAGFVSIFDPYAIKSMTFYKGGFPAQYGGKISSVLDIYLKEGDLNEYHGEAILGTFSGKIALEGPIKKGQSSFLVSFRRSTIDLYLRGIYAFQKPEDKFLYHYSDLNVKLNHRIDSKNHLFLSFYRGGDDLSTTGTRTFAGPNNVIRNYSNRYLNNWGNQFFSLRWNRTFSNGMFLNTTFAYSDFNYNMESGDAIKDNGEASSSNEFKFGVGVKDLVFKSELDIPVNTNLNLKTGVQLISHDFQPVDWRHQRIQLSGMGRYENADNVKISALESFFYIQSRITAVDNKLSLNPGFRAGNYRLENSRDFLILEPRFNANYRIFEDGLIEFDYSKMTQMVHSLNTSGTSLTPDIWIPVTENMRPATSDQISLSVSKPIGGIDVLIGGYYKEMQNLIEYNRNSGFGMTKGNWEEGVFTDGSGRAFGLELSADKRFDRFNIEGNYTFSRSLRKFGQINEGRTFSHHFDRPHNINLGSSIRLNAKSKLSLQWVYQSGQPITLGSQTYLALGNVRFSHRDPYLVITPDLITSGLSSPSFMTLEGVILIDEINNFRMPSHHRLDIAYAHQKQWKNGWNRTFTASLYNAYNRQNAYYLFLEKEDDGFKFYKLTLFPILPTISYGIKF